MIAGTVALPVWKSKKIVWLAIESLCRQEKPIGTWELIIFEEKHSQQIGESFFRNYEDRLKEVGCEKLSYITSAEQIPLARKWVIMANLSDPESRYFCLHGADDYSHPYRLIETEMAINEVEWVVTTKGYFYDFNYDKVIAYNLNSLTGMQMAVRTDLAKMLPVVNRNCGVDGWFVRSLIKQSRERKKQLKCYMSSTDQWQKILCTNGLNNISKNRHEYFKNVQPPFWKTDKKLIDIVPSDIYFRLIGIAKSLKVNDDLG